MKTYQEIKQELKHRRNSTKHFTKAFFAQYIEALDTIKKNAEKGIDDSYNDNGIYTRHAYDAIRQSEFYNRNSGAYCEFLSIMAKEATPA